MKRKLTKLVFVFVAYLGLMVIDGCDTSDDGCSCPTVEFPFFDYKTVALLPGNNRIDAIENLEIVLRPEEIDFIACKQKFSLGLINKAYACTCIGNGSEGDKFAIKKIEVFADQSFKDGIAANENISHLFQFETEDGLGNKEERELDSLGPDGLRFSEFQNITVFTTEKPDKTGLDVPYSFTLKITKDNETVIESVISDIIFL